MIDKLHYISPSTAQQSPIPAIKRALAAGCKWIQLRVKDEPESKILQYALAAKALCEEHQAMLIVNDHPAIALSAGANGVHLGLQDMPVKKARLMLSTQLLIGGTANTFDDILQRAAEGVDYIGLGPFRFTRTKKNLSPVVGIDGYKMLMEKVKRNNITIPIIAIGGINLEDIPSLIETGVHGVAVSGAITLASDSLNMVNKMYSLLSPLIKQSC